jgi:hypothetical protein
VGEVIIGYNLEKFVALRALIRSILIKGLLKYIGRVQTKQNLGPQIVAEGIIIKDLEL